MVFAAAGLAPYHLLIYSVVYGSTAYQSFFSGIVAYKALPLEHFANLQSKVFPTYFAMQAVTTGLLLATPLFPLGNIGYAALGTQFVGSLINTAFLGPRSNRIKAQREAQMELEGKHYKDPTASDTMKSLNKQFARVHGISVLLNLAGFVGLTVYGFMLGHRLRI